MILYVVRSMGQRDIERVYFRKKRDADKHFTVMKAEGKKVLGVFEEDIPLLNKDQFVAWLNFNARKL